jgi:hypothetical protein
MSRIYFKIALPLFGMFILITGVIYARSSPYDDRDLRALLTPDGCPAPCIMGIRPGVTTAYEAVQKLQENPWVKDLQVNRNSDGAMVSAQWEWNGKQPSLIPSQSPAFLLFSMTDEGAIFIDKMTLTTSVPIAYAYLLMGQPNTLQSWAADKTPPDAVVGANYRDHFFTVWSVVPCPMTKFTFWEAPMKIDFFSRRSQYNMEAYGGANAYC